MNRNLSEHERRALRLAKPVHDPRARRAWSFEHPRCQACGIPWWLAINERVPEYLAVHHIVKPGRSDEPCNFIKLCGWCHLLAENERLSGYPGLELTLGGVLWMKRESDPGEWDPRRLAELYGRALPEPAEPDHFFAAQRRRYRA